MHGVLITTREVLRIVRYLRSLKSKPNWETAHCGLRDESVVHSCRQNGVGFNSMCARAGAVLAPLIRLLEVFHHTIPMLIYGIAPVAAGGFCLLLPETLNVELQDDIEMK